MTGLSFLLAAAVAVAAPKAEIRNVRISSPKILMSREKSGSSVRLVGQFKVDMSFAASAVRCPVAKLCCLYEIDKGLQMACKVLDRPGTVSGMPEASALQGLKAAGVEVDAARRADLWADPAVYTPYLGLVGKKAYASALYGSFDLGKGFFKVGKSQTMPKLLLFRIEIWQNGVLVARHESPRTGLGAYSLPDDWHVWKRHPDKFKYVK